MSLEIVDVGDCAEDNNTLLEKFKQQTGSNTASVEGWLLGQPIQVRGPYKHTTALIIQHSSGDGTVKIFFENRNVATYQTDRSSGEGVQMVLLPAGFYCWWTLDASVKLYGLPLGEPVVSAVGVFVDNLYANL
ncbi:hypothetical protein GQ43DRAFT_467528 [Delitschia confertaspora ATCC 74209]|uniref:Uncharacterized protein n=1 Tax=Delitschia confertaspora ATCC 74209 TaxID=1513339 RepID=A0A9P4JCX1_9PLEO|nr:hypothetical protein GQ43DRAFT_467528 [Delitschia confertaspora ATCC 74209]